jgi:hypothetical protein
MGKRCRLGILFGLLGAISVELQHGGMCHAQAAYWPSCVAWSADCRLTALVLPRESCSRS